MDQPCCSNGTTSFDLPEIISLPSSPDPEIIEVFSSTSHQRHKRPTNCSICGKSASGYHYDVASCNGCKTFFRRLCVSEKNFACKANKDCFDLTIRVAPVKCRACRYLKCIAVGMNPLAMELDEREATAGNFKKLTKRKKGEGDGEEQQEEQKQELDIVAQKQVIRTMESMENRMQKMIDMLTYLESKLEVFRRSAYNPHWAEINGIEQVLLSSNRISLADRYGPMPNWPLYNHTSRPPPPPGFRPGAHRGPPPHHPDRKQWFFFNLLTSVEYVKTFEFFHKLKTKDQLILSKYVVLACTNLHVSFSVVSKKFDVIVQPDGSQQPYRDEEHYNSVVMSVAPLIRYKVQKVEYTLLKAICMCNPAIPDLSEEAQTILIAERERYADALFDHCLRNGRDGPSRFAHLIGIIELLERQQRMQKDLHLLHIAPLLAKLPAEHTIRLIEDVMDN